MRIALRIAAVLMALLVGAVLFFVVMFAGPTLYGLRPHAVESDIKQHKVSDLLALAENGPATGVVIYDAWHKGRDGRTGWFMLPLDRVQDVAFHVNGALDPGISKLFGAAPRRCKGTGLSEKMIRVVEPDRGRTGFLGRSSCKRAKMDLRAAIAASLPATRHEAQMTHAELSAFDAQRNPLILRDDVEVWPTPYAYFRTLSLPVVWEASNLTGRTPIYTLTEAARRLAQNLHRDGVVGVKVQTQDWSPSTIIEDEVQLLPFGGPDGVVLLPQITVRRIDFVVLCAPDQRAACDAVDVSGLVPQAAALRDMDQWQRVLQAALPPPEGGAWRGLLGARAQQRATLRAPAAEARRFSVTWIDATAP